MTVLLDTRPGGADHFYRPGSTFTVTWSWPAGYLTGRTFTATLDGVALAVAVVDDDMTVSATAAQTTAAAVPASFVLAEMVAGDPVPQIIGTWVASERAATSQSAAVQVTAGAAAVAVSVTAGPGSAPSRLLDSAELTVPFDATGLVIGQRTLVTGSTVTVPDVDRPVLLQGRGPLVCVTTANTPIILGIVPAGGTFADRLDEAFCQPPSTSTPTNVQTEVLLAAGSPGDYQLYVSTYSFSPVTVGVSCTAVRKASLRAVEL
jgi:hypothetical protein